MKISAQDAIDLLRDPKNKGLQVEDLEKKFGFVIGEAGSANTKATVAVEAAPEPVFDEELLALVEAVRAKAHTKTQTGKALKTSDGRPKAVLGRNDSIGGYTVIINGTK